MQNLALNIAEKGFPISVYNRSYEKTEAAEKRAEKAGVCSTSENRGCVLPSNFPTRYLPTQQTRVHHCDVNKVFCVRRVRVQSGDGQAITPLVQMSLPVSCKR